MTIYYQDDRVTVHRGDCLDVLAELPEASVDAVVTDPPYGLNFMGKEWDAPGASMLGHNTELGGGGWSGRPGAHSRGYADNDNAKFQKWCHRWAAELLRILKPGGHLLAFGGTRTWHRLACAIEDAGFEIRDSIAWMHGMGFPKSLDVSKAIDKAAGAEREVLGAPATAAAKRWQGWGTALKPAFEPIVVARKPLQGTVAANVLEHGTGAINIDACRVDSEPRRIENYASTGPQGCMSHGYGGGDGHAGRERTVRIETAGRWPTNVVLDIEIADQLDAQTGVSVSRIGKPRGAAPGDGWGMTHTGTEYADTGGASRFFPVFRYEAKAPGTERPSVNGVAHPTVKPLDLMRWLVRLVTPPNGVVLDPFAGSGTTVEAAMLERVRCIAIEREADYLPLIDARIQRARKATAQGVLDLWGAGA